MKIIGLAMAIGLAVAITGSAQAADADAGETVFKRCKVCHEVEQPKNKVGPNLVDVFGRTPGTLDSFKYSSAMRAFGESRIWDEATLTEYLAAPRKVVKGTRMAFPGLKKPEDIANVLAYLKQFSKE